MNEQQRAALTMPLENASDIARIYGCRTITENAQGQLLIVVLAVDR
jgi:hypothetical protein